MASALRCISRAMITAATITAIERMRDSVLPGKEHVTAAEAWHAVTRLMRTERRNGRDHRRRAILVWASDAVLKEKAARFVAGRLRS